MSFIEVIILGIVQGLTEFLPVSSSGHLELIKAFFGNESIPKESMMLTVVLHFATALSTIVVFRSELIDIFKGLFQFKWNEQTQFSLKIVISMLPAGIIGILFNDQIEQLFSGRVLLVGLMLLLTGLLLFLCEKSKLTGKKITFKNALIIGIAQAIAILPGISRSGATISTSVLLGNDKYRASRFSFLMVVPLILGKIAKDILDGSFHLEQTQMNHLLVGFIVSFIFGVLACKWMITLVRKSKLRYFAIYCFLVGLTAMVIHFV